MVFSDALVFGLLLVLLFLLGVVLAVLSTCVVGSTRIGVLIVGHVCGLVGCGKEVRDSEDEESLSTLSCKSSRFVMCLDVLKDSLKCVRHVWYLSFCTFLS